MPPNGDRVFLLLQGKKGPAILGCGTIATPLGKQAKPKEQSILFDALTDPEREVLANRADLTSDQRRRKRLAYPGKRYRNTRASRRYARVPRRRQVPESRQ